MPFVKQLTTSERNDVVKSDEVGMADLSGLVEELLDVSKSKGAAFTKGLGDLLTSEGEKIADLMRHYAPRKTGALAKAIEVGEVEITRDKVTVPVGPKDIKYSSYLEYGTGKFNKRNPGGQGYWIKAKAGKALKFTGKDGRDVFVKKVFHPGIKPQPFIAPALKDYGDELHEKVGDELVRIIINDPSKPPKTKTKRRDRKVTK